METITVEQDIYTVSQLNQAVRCLMEDTFPFVWVEGEVSNFAAPHSGHWYFCLKDSNAQVRCAMFRGQQRKLGFTPKNGSHILIKARVSLYENRGEFQLIVESMEERGEGKLRQAFEVLKKKLEAAGLFESQHKQTLPAFPACIGIITSATGAAIHDILTVLKRRYPIVPIILYPTLVQGAGAAPMIAAAIALANQRRECDLLILARGGGSLEDLWPFNEEIVAQAIHASVLPLLSGIGHEVDFTIADFVADKRAPTPSAAAEIATPDQAELLQLLHRYQHQLSRALKTRLLHCQQQLSFLEKHLAQLHPRKRLFEKMQRLDNDALQIQQCINRTLHAYHRKLAILATALKDHTPLQRIQRHQQQLAQHADEFHQRIYQHLHQKRLQLASLSAKLDALSPLATLKRGYAIVTMEMTPDQHIIKDAADVPVGSQIEIKLDKGKLSCQVEKVIIP